MKMWIEKSPYWLKAEGVKKVEELKGAVFMGHWAIKTRSGAWSETPVDVFYQPNPDVSLGHTHYFGMFVRDEKLFITEASTAFSSPIHGVLASDGEVIVSRYCHDFQQRKGVMVDGGRDYIRSSWPVTQVLVEVDGADFKFTVQDPRAS